MKRLLVVAESSLIVEAIAIGLRASGEFELLGQIDGQQASTQAILDARPDVVLIDEMEDHQRMFDIIRRLTEHPDDVKVIVLTLAAPAARLDEIFAAGATSAVSKATQPAALATVIRETLNGHVLRLHRPARAAANAVASPAAQGGLLSRRELEVLQLVAAGATNGDIARKLWVTEQTVKFHLSNIYRKLKVGNRTEASRYAHLHGLVGGDFSAGN